MNARICAVAAALVGMVPSASSATIYITNPSAGGGTAAPGPQTTLFSIEEDGTGLTNLGSVTIGGGNASIGAIATDSFGTLYGSLYDSGTDSSTLVTIDTVTLEAFVVGAGTPVAGFISGAAFDRDGVLWVYDRTVQGIYELDISTLSAVGIPIPLPNPANINGGDLAFDLDGNCYFQGTLEGNSSTPLYSCDLAAGTVDPIGSWSRVGPWADAGHSFSGVGFSLDVNTCEPVFLGSDGYGIDELAELDIATMTAEEVANTGVNISWYNQVDVGSFASIALVPACDTCGDGIIDAAEECDDGNLVDGDGCSSVCLDEPDDACARDPKDWNHTPVEQWPVEELTHFGNTLTAWEASGWLSWDSPDPSVMLFQELLAFDLNVADGTDPGQLAGARQAAIDLIWEIGVALDPQGEDAAAAQALVDQLGAYNDGLAGPPECECEEP